MPSRSSSSNSPSPSPSKKMKREVSPRKRVPPLKLLQERVQEQVYVPAVNVVEEVENVQRSDVQFGFMNEHRQKKNFIDMSISVKGVIFPVHKIMVSSLSSYFLDKLLLNEKPGYMMVIDHDDVYPDIFASIVDYAYTGKVTLTSTNVYQFISTVNFLDITFLQKKCEDFVIKNLNDDNVFYAIHFSFTHCLCTLKKASAKYFTKHLSVLSTSQFFQDIDPEFLTEIFADNDLSVAAFPALKASRLEGVILLTIIVYQKARKLDEDKFRKLLYTVRLPFIEDKHMKIFEEKFRFFSNNVFKKFLALHPLVKLSNKDRVASDGIPENWNIKRESHYEFHLCQYTYGLPKFGLTKDPQKMSVTNQEMHISSITVWHRKGDNKAPTILSGIKVNYRCDGVEGYHTYSQGHYLEPFPFNIVQFDREEGITELCLWTYEDSYFIGGISFLTTKGRSLQPFGGTIGIKHRLICPKEPGFLYAILCDSTFCRCQSTIINITPQWICC